VHRRNSSSLPAGQPNRGRPWRLLQAAWGIVLLLCAEVSGNAFESGASPGLLLDEALFAPLAFQAEQLPSPNSVLAPDQPGTIRRWAGELLAGSGDPQGPVLDPNQVGNVRGRLAAFEDAGANLPIVQLSGFFQLDDGLFSQPAASRERLGDIQDGLSFRRTRLQAVGQLTEFVDFTIMLDFSLQGRPSFGDVWGEQSEIPFLGTVRIGQFRPPSTMEGWTSVRHLEFLERSTPYQAFNPHRRIGAMAYAMSDNERTSWAACVYGTGLTFWDGTDMVYQTFGDNRTGIQIGDNGGVTFSSRITHLVHYDEPSEGRSLLHVGAGYVYSQLGGEGTSGPFAKTYNSQVLPEFFVGDPAGGGRTAAGTPFVLSTGRILANDFSLYHVELAGNAGQFHFQSEVLLEAVNQRGGPTMLQPGAYAQCGYFLTGEHPGYLKEPGVFDYNVVPFSPFFGTGRHGGVRGWGAWEVAFRWSYLDLSCTNLNPANEISDPARRYEQPPVPNFGVLNESTLALNWWWNRFTRVQLNWIHSMPDSLGSGPAPFDIVGTRFQVEF
jgi:phosphate-selective porin OprO and OprP